MIICLLFFISLSSPFLGVESLKCYEGRLNRTQTLDQLTETTCEKYQDWCYSLHTSKEAGLEVKMCWNKDWEHGRYKEDGCIVGQHCFNGQCYENATVCLCNDKDLCNGYTENGNVSTPIPYPPTTPPDSHQCYYSVKENNIESGLQYTEVCQNSEQLCVVVTSETEDYEYRSCFDPAFNDNYNKPGCYKGFQHCHRDICHNDTTLCVCADSLCNVEHYSSEAPPFTPGSGLFCYEGGWHDYDYEAVECSKNENYCISFTSLESNHTKLSCWDPDMYNKYNYTGCEISQACIDGECYNSTVCLCQDDLCNGFGVDGSTDITTPVPVPMTTSNMTMVCWYGIDYPGADHEKEWVKDVCAPMEDRCILVVSEDHAYGHCYDIDYDNGRYADPGTYDTGEHCFRGNCYNGTVFVCTDPLCNSKGAVTPAPHPTTPGSGLDCYYGMIGPHDKPENLTTQICNKNETMCMAIYGEDNVFIASCLDPNEEEGRYNTTDVCYEGLHCWHHDDGDQSCHNGTLCTCDDNMCNNYNVSSTLPTEAPLTTNANTMSCYFGEKHPDTGEEEWKVEVCESTEHYCYQLVHGEGDTRSEIRQCWDLSYEDGHYHGAGCIKEDVNHHEHQYKDATVCICKEALCNGWSKDGNVTTYSPETPGSGLTCYSGNKEHHEGKSCTSAETMCMAFIADGHDAILDCYDPKSNDQNFAVEDCWGNVQIEQSHHEYSGRLCLCTSELCNEQFLDKPGSSSIITLSYSLILSILFVYSNM